MIMNNHWRVVGFLVLPLCALLGAPPANGGLTCGNAGQPGSVVRVEEDWTLIVNQPDQNVAAPQLSSQMSQNGTGSIFCNLHLNARDFPKYGAGGLQVQIWKGDSNVASKTWDTWAVMNTPNEVVTWTQFLDTSNGQVTFGVSAASSQTWGDFSGQQIVVPTSVLSLDNYTVDYSVANSGITFGANRVSYLAVTAVRIYYQDGSVQTDSTERIVYPAPDNSP
jgi:hypothetical protein